MKIEFALNLQAIPKEKIWVSEKGVKYLTVVVTEKREPDQYGKTHTVYVKPTKEDVQNNVRIVYLGNGKVREENNNGQQQTGQSQPQPQAHTYTPPPPPASSAPVSKPEDDFPF